MSTLVRSVACLAVLGLVGLSPVSAEAATLKRNLPCTTIYFVFGALTRTTNSSSVVIKNTGSSAIPAGTVYSYTISAGSFDYRNPSSLGPAEVLSVPDARVTSSGTCSASVPGIVLKNRLDAVPLQKLTLAPN